MEGSTRECQDDGSWSGSAPVCDRKLITRAASMYTIAESLINEIVSVVGNNLIADVY